jgi:hypothetical protein
MKIFKLIFVILVAIVYILNIVKGIQTDNVLGWSGWLAALILVITFAPYFLIDKQK